MPRRQVQRYYAEWNPNQHKGSIIFRYSPTEADRLETKNPAEFNAVLMILSSSELAFTDGNGTVSTGDTEDIDD